MTSYEGVLGLAMSWLWLWSVGFDLLLSCGGCVCVCVCLGLSQCFWGPPECAGDGFLGIIDLILLQSREPTVSIYSNQGCVFS